MCLCLTKCGCLTNKDASQSAAYSENKGVLIKEAVLKVYICKRDWQINEPVSLYENKCLH